MDKTKNIAKNTVVLYVRMIVTMLVTLYSSRIILEVLGFEDFGLFNVVGGVVALLSFLRTSLTSSTQRFLSYELGMGDFCQLKKVFSISLSTHFLIGIIIIFLSETIGVWFLNTHIQIPEGRETAANWIFQFSVISLFVSTITVPYNADIISHERMTYYAFVSILEAILKLLFAYALLISKYDNLILYGGLMMFVNVIDLILYWGFCRLKFAETQYMLFWDKNLFSKVFSFSSWTIVGQLSVIGANQGTNVLVNIFHSVVANASMGIAQQVNNALTGLTANFQTAFQPQLTKSYAAKDYDYMNQLMFQASKISFFLLFLASLPIMMNIDFVLQLWLGKVPEYASEFCIWFVVASLLNAVSTPLWISIFATGKIRNYQIIVSSFFFSDILIVYLLFRYSCCSPVMAMVVKAIINLVVLFIRILYTKSAIPDFSVWLYIKNVLIPISTISVVSVFLVYLAFSIGMHSWMAIVNTFVIFFMSCAMSFIIGLTRSERNAISHVILNKIK